VLAAAEPFRGGAFFVLTPPPPQPPFYPIYGADERVAMYAGWGGKIASPFPPAGGITRPGVPGL